MTYRAVIVPGYCTDPSCTLYDQEQLCEVDEATLDGYGEYHDWDAVCEECHHETTVWFNYDKD